MDDAARPKDVARHAIDLISRASEDGLDPDDYGTVELTALVPTLDGPSDVPPTIAARFDVQLSASMLRYFSDLHLGRVDPRTLGWQLTVPAERHNLAAVLRTAIESGSLDRVVTDLAPHLAQYGALKRALARYRALAAQPLPAPAIAIPAKPGEPMADAGALHRLLVALGDLPESTSPPQAGVYDDTLRSGIARFQARHGLDPDGVIGKTTMEALGVTMAWRVRQIELALERLRWLPDLDGRVIAVNIPMFQLWAWNNVPSDTYALTMNVVVGRALDTRTPVFADRMEYVVFRPYWNVPTSIARNEILPSIRKTPDYLSKQNMEIVRGAADNAPAVAVTPEVLAELGRNNVRVRQRPGPANSLGLVKFMFPNQNDVYMHDTPATQLFARARRDFSHGCIRVENPAALAEWVLGWPHEQVVAAMRGANNRRVDLTNLVQVVIFYTTAAADPATGLVRFATDVYKQDGVLDKGIDDLRVR